MNQPRTKRDEASSTWKFTFSWRSIENFCKNTEQLEYRRENMRDLKIKESKLKKSPDFLTWKRLNHHHWKPTGLVGNEAAGGAGVMASRVLSQLKDPIWVTICCLFRCFLSSPSDVPPPWVPSLPQDSQHCVAVRTTGALKHTIVPIKLPKRLLLLRLAHLVASLDKRRCLNELISWTHMNWIRLVWGNSGLHLRVLHSSEAASCNEQQDVDKLQVLWRTN